MRLISSKLTWWHKKAFPTFWFGILALTTVMLIPGALDGSVPPEVLLIPLVMAGSGAVLVRWLVVRPVDEVWIDGDELVVRNRGEEDRFPIANIVDVDGSYTIGLWLKPACRFGKTIRFEAP